VMVACARTLGQAEELEPVGVAVDDVQRLPADGASRTEDRDVQRTHLKQVEDHHVEVDEDRREQDRVDAVEDTAVAGDEVR
jgi:hypothetical protein